VEKASTNVPGFSFLCFEFLEHRQESLRIVPALYMYCRQDVGLAQSTREAKECRGKPNWPPTGFRTQFRRNESRDAADLQDVAAGLSRMAWRAAREQFVPITRKFCFFVCRRISPELT